MSRPQPQWTRRIFRVPGADYMHEWDTALDAHDDRALDAIRADGFNAVWIRGILRDLVRTRAFPELAPQSDACLSRLNTLIDRCARHQLDVFLYLNEPLGFPSEDPFWSRHPDLKGEPGSSHDDNWSHSNALCTSTNAVRDWLRQSMRNLFAQAPGLAGVFLITASEHHTHCYSHDWDYAKHREAGLKCPRCRQRSPAEIVGEIVTLIQQGARESKPNAEILVWNWSWSLYEPDPQPDLIAHLPDGVTLLADFERGGTRRLSLHNQSADIEKELFIDEYSLAYVGPSPRFLGALEAAHARGIPCYAKLQIGTTHEIATVPNLPLIPHLYRKFARMRERDVRGFLGCWNFGNDPTLNTFAVRRLTGERFPENETAFLDDVARGYFPGCDSPSVVAAWRDFCQAMELHPFSHAFLYLAPVNYAPVRPWKLDPPSKPMGWTWHVLDDYGDRLEDCVRPVSSLDATRTGFSLEDIDALLTELVRRWNRGVEKLERGLQASTATAVARLELGVSRMIGHQFRSTRNIFRFYRLRQVHKRWDAVLRDEIQNLTDCLPLVEADPRLGLHRGSFPRPHRFYDANGIRRQIDHLRSIERTPSTPTLRHGKASVKK